MAFLNPHHRAYRYLVLFLICVLTFGGYYSYDLPGSLSYAYTDPSILNLSAFQYNLLYSVYSWPNTILPFFGGYISDKWLGIRASTIMFAVFVACGQALVAFGITAKSFVLIIIGRTVAPPHLIVAISHSTFVEILIICDNLSLYLQHRPQQPQTRIEFNLLRCSALEAKASPSLKAPSLRAGSKAPKSPPPLASLSPSAA
jgi:hypothetical protein